MTRTFIVRVSSKGGPGSGHRGHGGRPGKRGGSAPKMISIGSGEFESHGNFGFKGNAVGFIRAQSGEENLTKANLLGWRIVESGDRFHVINTKGVVSSIAEPVSVPIDPRMLGPLGSDTDTSATNFEELPDVSIAGASTEALKDMGLKEEEIVSMFSVPGAKTSVKLSHDEPGVVRARVIVRDESNVLATADRVFGYRGCNNEVFKVSSDSHGKGIASALYSNQINVLRGAGYKNISLDADITIGRYAWAKQGFRYFDKSEAGTVTDKFPAWAKGKGVSKPSGGWPTFKNPQDVANFKLSGISLLGNNITNRDVPSDMSLSLGKAFLLDMSSDGHGSWDGVLDL